MENFINQQNDFNKEITSRIQKMESDAVEHGKRLNAFEKEINTMTGKFERMSSMMEKMNDKLDNHTESINDIKVQFPTFMNEFVDKNAKRTQEIVTTHQVKCSKEMDTKFLAVPEGWKGYAVRGFLILMAGLFGLDMSGILPIIPKQETHPRYVSESLHQHGQTFLLKDASGNVFKLSGELASDSHK